MPIMVAKDLYDHDFFEWTRSNASLLRAGNFDQADVEHIAEELEDMGKREQHELRSRLRVLLMHLLKWQAQPERRVSKSWQATIVVQRADLGHLLSQMPSLQNLLKQQLPEVYRLAALKAAAETRMAPSNFPKTCPFSLEQILDEKFLPE